MPFGVEHAWCLTGTGIVLDPTWPPGLGVVYIGIAVTSAYRSSVAESSLLHPHPAGLALLRDGLAPAAAHVAGAIGRRLTLISTWPAEAERSRQRPAGWRGA